ncbi:sterol desaturase family protein [Pelomonas sp. KK5]|uniref:sterol desaturase family protein n=1 Tax=Pelomonas sp. KK5 TaxID=1855730 RepID=UPI00097BE751|nr:sterol desaturase family protein [Pelomonas sp. KK5]
MLNSWLQSTVSLLAWLLLAAAIFVPLERWFAARLKPLLRPQWGNDLAFYFLGGWLPPLAGAVISAVFVAIADALLPASYFRWLGGLSPWVVVPALVVLGDFFYYWAHRLSHQIPLLWRFHAIHHSAEQMDWLVNTRAHPLDLIVTRTLGSAPLILIGLKTHAATGSGAMVFAIVAFNVLWAFFIHSNVRWRFGWLEQLITTPAFHHWHHANEGPATNDKNYAAVLPWLDRLFGTQHLPDRLPRAYGIGEPLSPSLAGLLLDPFAPPPAARKQQQTP